MENKVSFPYLFFQEKGVFPAPNIGFGLGQLSPPYFSPFKLTAVRVMSDLSYNPFSALSDGMRSTTFSRAAANSRNNLLFLFLLRLKNESGFFSP